MEGELVQAKHELNQVEHELEVTYIRWANVECDLSMTEEARQIAQRQFDWSEARNQELIWELKAIHWRIARLIAGNGVRARPVVGEAFAIVVGTSRGVPVEDPGVADV